MDPVEEPTDPAELAAKWHPWACREALRFSRGCRSIDQAELIGAARLALWRAALRYRPEQGIPFCGFAKKFLQRDLLECLRRSRPKGFRILSQERRDAEAPAIMPLSDAVGKRLPDRRAAATEPVDLSAVWESSRPLLSDREYEVLLSRYRDARSYQSIAEALGLRRQRVHQIVCRALMKLAQSPELAALAASL